VVSVHHLHEDFLRFIDALAAGEGDPWDLYCKHYLDPHRPALGAWWSQVLGLPEETWIDRVRQIRPEQYEVLRALVAETDLERLACDTVARCQSLLPLSPEPHVYYLVGFFSPDGFAFEVDGAWAIGIGLERLTSTRLIPILLAHEYAHCYRRRFTRPRRLGERLVEEGFAVELAARALPDLPTADHLLMRRGQLALMRQYEDRLREAIAPHLASEDEDVAARILYGRGPKGTLPSRAGVYLGWRIVRDFLAAEQEGFDSDAEVVLRSAGFATS